jgi:hypothetical protein
MKEKDLILEITRMREIMGINPLKSSTIKTISEDFKTTNGILLFESNGGGKGELGTLILKGLGFGDEVASSVGKQVADEWEGAAKQFADSLKKEGLDDIGKIQQKIRLFRPNLEMSDELMKNYVDAYFKNNPEVAKDLIKKLPDVVNEINKKFNTSSFDSLVPTSIKETLEILRSLRIDDFTDDLIKDYDILINELMNKNVLGGVYNTNQNVKNYMDGLFSHLTTIQKSKKIGDSTPKIQTQTKTTEPEIKNDSNNKPNQQEFLPNLIPYKEDSTGTKVFLNVVEPEAYSKYLELTKKPRSSWNEEDSKLYTDIVRWESDFSVDFSKYKIKQDRDTNLKINANIKELPQTQFHIGGTSIDSVRSPGWRPLEGSDSKIVRDDHSAFNSNAPGAYQYFSFTTREDGENIIYSFHRKDIFDAAGRQGNFIVAVSYPKNSNVKLDDVKQILVDKSNEIYQQWKSAYDKKDGGASIGSKTTPQTSTPNGNVNNNVVTSEVPIIKR